MEDLKIEGSLKTFAVECNASTGRLVISGRSIPENSFDFFDPIFAWLNQYVNEPQPLTELNLYIEYFNTASSKCLLDIFRLLEGLGSNDQYKVAINWYYEEEDEDMEYAGEDFKAVVNIPFTIQAVEQF